MSLQNSLTYREAQANATAPVRSDGGAAEEFVEDSCLGTGRQAWTVVSHSNFSAFFLCHRGNLYRTTWRCIARGVFQQIHKNLLHQEAVNLEQREVVRDANAHIMFL